MNLYEVAISTYEASSGRPERYQSRRAILRDEIATTSLESLLLCIQRIEEDDAEDAELLNAELRADLEVMKRRVRDLVLH